ncbi:MAG: PAS domain-containing protein [Chroococcales cyanobacterium]
MLQLIQNIFTSNNFMPHGSCYLWKSGLVGLHVTSDSLITLAYFSIPVTLIYFVKKREDLPFDWIFVLFGAFIILCGMTHAMEVWTLWYPFYWVSGVTKAMTAGVSLLTAGLLIPLMPKALAIPSPTQLAKANEKLEAEIQQRQQIEAELENSRQMLQLVIDNIPQLIFWKDCHSVYLGCNRGFAKTAGFENPEDVVGKTDDELPWQSAEAEVYRADDLAVIESKIGQYHILELQQQADGKQAWLDTSKIPLFNPQGDAIGVLGTVEDITARKESEEALKLTKSALEKEREFLNAVLDNLVEGVVACDSNGVLSLFNQATREFHGLPEKPLPADEWANYFDLYLPDGETLMTTEEIPLLQAFQGKRVVDSEFIIAPKNGQKRVCLASGQPIINQQGKKLGAVVAIHDITERKQAEEARKKVNEELEKRVKERTQQLQEVIQELQQQIKERQEAQSAQQKSEQQLRAILDNAPTAIYLKDTESRLMLVNPLCAKILGFEPKAVYGKELYEYLPKEAADELRENDLKVLKQGKPLVSEEILPQEDGEHIYQSIKFPIYNAEGLAYAIGGISTDITERKLADEQLKASEAKYKEIATLAETKAKELEKTLTELQQTQSQLLQSEKMAGLGQLVAGVAHEINNPVNFIHGNLVHTHDYIEDLLGLIELYEAVYPESEPEIEDEIEAIDLEFVKEDLPKALASMQVGTERIREIVKSLRTFSRLDEAEMKEVDIHEGIESTLLILQNRLKGKGDRQAIKVSKDYGKIPLVDCYAGQLNQVFMNLISNGIDALEYNRKSESPEDPTIRIATEIIDQKWVVIRISDNGTGIPEDVRSRIFDPFYTTKPIGKGTGLGLSISYQIVVDKHGGKLVCNSQPNQGTEFAIYLPIEPKNEVS